MTYNVHGCGGMDGRVSPRRIARVAASYMPDLLALQEVDLGRRRSRAEDQAAMIAHQLGMHVVFCPTITRGLEHYGHALLSRWPIEIVKRAHLPHDPKGWWKEPRSALWARVMIGDTAVHVVTTHLGLGLHERLLQMREAVSKVLEPMRADGAIGASLEAEVEVLLAPDTLAKLAPVADELRFFFITSRFDLKPVDAGRTEAPWIHAVSTTNAKCVRCWHYRPEVGADAGDPELCGRCIENVRGAGETRRFF